MKGKINHVLILLIAMALAACLSFPASAQTTYIDRGIGNTLIPHHKRDKVDTKMASSTTKYSKYVERGSFDNRHGKRTKTFTYSYSESNSRSFTLGANIPKSILKKNVSVSIGGGLSWSKAETLSGSTRVPAKKVGHAYVRTKTVTTKYKHVIQCQEEDPYRPGKWRNIGKVRTTYSTVTTKTPQIKIASKSR